jgi:SOS-response transcriptional repressor LexA
MSANRTGAYTLAERDVHHADVLYTILTLTALLERPPSQAEVARAMNNRAKSTIGKVCRTLRKRGYLCFQDWTPADLQVTPSGEALVERIASVDRGR